VFITLQQFIVVTHLHRLERCILLLL
jgi:hypothetical protein